MGRGKGRWWPLRRGLTEADVLDGVEWEEPGLRSGPTWTLSLPLACWPPAVAGHRRLYGKQGRGWDLAMSVFTEVT